MIDKTGFYYLRGASPEEETLFITDDGTDVIFQVLALDGSQTPVTVSRATALEFAHLLVEVLS